MRWRMITARVLVLLAAIFAVLSLIAGFVRWQGLDTDSVDETAELMIADPEIRDQMATTLVESIYANVDVAAALEERLPEAQQGFAPVVAGAMRELSDRAAQRLLERPRAQALWVRSIAVTHEQLLRLLDDDLTAVQTEGGYLVLNLRPLVVQLGDRVAIFGRVAERLPPDAGRIQVMEADQLETAQDLTQLLRTLGSFLFLVPLALAAIALWLATGRRRSILLMLGIALVIAGLLVLVARSVGGAYVVDSLVTTETERPAAESAWDIITRLLRESAWLTIALGAIALLGVWLTGGSSPATATRRRLAPYLARPEYAYGAAALLLLLLVWWAPVAQFRRGLAVLVMAILLGIGVEALRRFTAKETPAAQQSTALP
jgi:hypothetical protein